MSVAMRRAKDGKDEYDVLSTRAVIFGGVDRANARTPNETERFIG